ncbi:hypothetical protein [Prosthecobacter sp.]|uniref:hypothetical protein n=1 Tax=Prosthecobacter sp. TaxID=1965333 RepID=UPI003782F0FD
MIKYIYNELADEALEELYTTAGATSTGHKITVIERELGGVHNFYAFGGKDCGEAKLGCLEHEYLSLRELIPLELV